MSNAWAGGSTRWWREVARPTVLERDGYRCQLKLQGVCTTVATHVHHTLGKRVSGDRDLTKLVAACAPCNLKAGDPSTSDPAPSPRTWWRSTA